MIFFFYNPVKLNILQMINWIMFCLNLTDEIQKIRSLKTNDWMSSKQKRLLQFQFSLAAFETIVK